MKYSPYKQGYFRPVCDSKYRGTRPIIYRSGLELTFYRWCDRNEKVTQWGSESVVIPYISPIDGKTHRYFVDAVLILNVNDTFKKYIVEIKPSTQIHPPRQTGKKKKETVLYEQIQWARNQAKWEAARNWSAKHGYEFSILTEKDLR